VRAGDLVPHPLNWRTHPDNQRQALTDVLEEVGSVDALIVRELPDGTLQLVDGHLRQDIDHDATVWVQIVDLNDEETAKVLATFDSLTNLAEIDSLKLQELIASVDTTSESTRLMIESLAEHAGMFSCEETDMPSLPDGEREPFQQMTFTLHDDQAKIVKAALARAQKAGPFNGSPNENSNGNALSRIAEAYNQENGC
jgi:hypothetical protein